MNKPQPTTGSDRLFAGVCFSASRRGITVAFLTPRLDVRSLKTLTLAEAIDELCACGNVTAAIGGPAQPGRSVAAADIPPGDSLRAGKRAPARAAEAELARRGIPVRKTPALESAAPGWMRAAFQAAAELRARGFGAGPEARAADRALIEIHPTASAAALLGRLPFGRETLEGRMQRQLALVRERVGLRDPMDALEELTAHHILSGRLALEGIRTADELDALLAAFTAGRAYSSPGTVTWLGDDADGWLCIPVKELLVKYSK
jgi:hypothetical protein